MTAAKTAIPNRSDDMAAARQAGFAPACSSVEQSCSVFKSRAPLLTTAEKSRPGWRRGRVCLIADRVFGELEASYRSVRPGLKLGALARSRIPALRETSSDLTKG